MKKTIIILAAMGFVLALSVAFVGEIAAGEMSGTMIAMENGITLFEAGPVATEHGYTAWEPGAEMDNGITVFARGPVSYDSGMVEHGEEALNVEGSAAGGLSEGGGLHIENGITIFDTLPVDSN